jgi:hypothetical protein
MREQTAGVSARSRRALAASLLAALVAVAGCGTPSVRSAAPVAVRPSAQAERLPSPAPAGAVLIAVLERHRGSRAPDTVAIAGLDGRARARATFTPQPIPDTGHGPPLLQPAAQVVGGAVYYVDGLGVVRRLAVGGGPPATIAVFPLTSPQQVAAIAVRGDGTRLIASVLTVPAAGAPLPVPSPVRSPGRQWHVDVEVASAGGPTVTVRSIDLTAADPALPPRLLQVVGWDAEGPVALPDGLVAGRQTVGPALWQGHPSHLDSRGIPGPSLGGADCGTAFEQPDGSLLCQDAVRSVTTLRHPDGSVVHRFAHTGAGPRLSPDGRRLAYSLAPGRAAVQARDGVTVALAPGFTPTGWLDDGRLIGTLRGDELAVLTLVSPGQAVDLGVAGVFAGVVAG